MTPREQTPEIEDSVERCVTMQSGLPSRDTQMSQKHKSQKRIAHLVRDDTFH